MRAAVLALSMATLPAVAAAGAAGDSCDPGVARLTVPGGRVVTLRVELADTAPERAQGLMGRRSLVPGTGMLFLYPAPQRVSFWMHDTPLALDMLFFAPDGRLAHVHAGAVPLDETPIPGAMADDPSPERLAVIEIGAGEAARLGLVPGAVLAHAALDPDCALPPAR